MGCTCYNPLWAQFCGTWYHLYPHSPVRNRNILTSGTRWGSRPWTNKPHASRAGLLDAMMLIYAKNTETLLAPMREMDDFFLLTPVPCPLEGNHRGGRCVKTRVCTSNILNHKTCFYCNTVTMAYHMLQFSMSVQKIARCCQLSGLCSNLSEQ